MGKSSTGRFFEDFEPGEHIAHPTARTVTTGDQALYTALTGSRFAVHQSEAAARSLGHASPPLDDLLVFHLAFGRTVSDISLNAVANLGYAECKFLAPVFAGDSLGAASTVIGLKENSNGKTGTVHVRTKAVNQRGETVIEFVRWVMVNKRGGAPGPALSPPALAETVAPAATIPPPAPLTAAGAELVCGGSPHRFDDFTVGETIDHVDGVTVEEAEHMLATRLYHNAARVHFNAQAEARGRFGRRIVYGGHVMSIAQGALLQRPCQRIPAGGDQRRTPCGAGLRRQHDLCLVGGARQGSGRRAGGRRTPAHCDLRNEGHSVARSTARGGHGRHTGNRS